MYTYKVICKHVWIVWQALCLLHLTAIAAKTCKVPCTMLELPHANMHGLALTIRLKPAFAAAIWLQLGFWDHRDALDKID